MIIDDEGYPDITLEYCNHVADYKYISLKESRNEKGCCISLTTLMDMRREDEWTILKSVVSELKEVYIEDDIEIRNEELEKYKIFFLKTYSWRLSSWCPKCKIIKKPLSATNT